MSQQPLQSTSLSSHIMTNTASSSSPTPTNSGRTSGGSAGAPLKVDGKHGVRLPPSNASTQNQLVLPPLQQDSLSHGGVHFVSIKGSLSTHRDFDTFETENSFHCPEMTFFENSFALTHEGCGFVLSFNTADALLCCSYDDIRTIPDAYGSLFKPEPVLVKPAEEWKTLATESQLETVEFANDWTFTTFYRGTSLYIPQSILTAANAADLDTAFDAASHPPSPLIINTYTDTSTVVPPPGSSPSSLSGHTAATAAVSTAPHRPGKLAHLSPQAQLLFHKYASYLSKTPYVANITKYIYSIDPNLTYVGSVDVAESSVAESLSPFSKDDDHVDSQDDDNNNQKKNEDENHDGGDQAINTTDTNAANESSAAPKEQQQQRKPVSSVVSQIMNHSISSSPTSAAEANTTSFACNLHNADLQWETCSSSVNYQNLTKKEPILLYSSLILFEDELHDHGMTTLQLKARVMPSCYFILLRNFVRIDGVAVRVRDTRYYYEFPTSSSSTKNDEAVYIYRETKIHEATFHQLEQHGRSTQDRDYTIETAPQLVPVVTIVHERLNLTKLRRQQQSQ